MRLKSTLRRGVAAAVIAGIVVSSGIPAYAKTWNIADGDITVKGASDESGNYNNVKQGEKDFEKDEGETVITGKSEEHTVTIEGYGEGGMGVARIDGRVVFVHGALRGEKCRVLILKTLKSVAFAKVLEVIEPSSERITPDCPYFPRCGGCTYRHIRYEEELRLKK